MNQRHHTGRHYLKSPDIADLMAKTASITADEDVLEIGTGRCAITPLLGGKSITTYETDKNMYSKAISVLKKYPNIKPICGDGFKSVERFDVFVSSLPYSQSRRAIEWLAQKKFSRAVIMVQEEFASKLRAKSGRDRKAVSVLACCAFDMRKISSVSRKNFDPPPSVGSEILYLEQKCTISLETIHKINKIFSYRRKILSNIPNRTPNRSLDCVCFREATEGLYSGQEAMTSPDSAIAVRKITRTGCRRFAEASVRWAEEHKMKKMVAITKRNILKMTDGIFWEEMQRAADTMPGLELTEIYIDNMAQQMLVNTGQFDGAVLASTNLFMDIISELASGLIGSIGLIYSANIGDDFAMFEAAHGSAPSIAGKNIANPTATVLSGAWMADYLGEKHVRDAIFDATWNVINEGKYVTSDIGGSATTTQMAKAISEIARKNLKK